MAFKHRLKDRLGNRERVLAHPALARFAHRLQDRNLWHFGRRATAGGFGLGLFVAFVPIPIHMLVAPPLAILLRVNLPVTLATIWLSNPITLVPLLLLAYRIGCALTGTPVLAAGFAAAPTLDGFVSVVHQVWLPLGIGSVTCGIVAGLSGYAAVDWIWRWRIKMRRKQRRRARVLRHREEAHSGRP
jgi:uncharacterized protein (DUF2062 family)